MIVMIALATHRNIPMQTPDQGSLADNIKIIFHSCSDRDAKHIDPA